MASGWLTRLMVPSGESRYAGLTARQAAGRFLGRRRLTVAAYVVAVFVLAFSCRAWAGPDIEHPEAIAFFVVALLATIALFALLLIRDISGFYGILHTDLDPQKMLDAISIVMERRKGRKWAQATYAIICAQCSQQLGRDDVALQWVDHAERDLRPRTAQRVLCCNVRANAARHSGDYEELARIRGQLEALLQTSRRMAKAGALVLAGIDFGLALEAGDWERCNEAIGTMRETAITPIQRLSPDVEAARLAAAQGDLTLARERFASVAARGGGIRAARDAAAWLAAHPAQAREPAAAAGRA